MSVHGILGRKIGMTQLHREDGAVEAVTALKAGPCTVTQVKSVANEGYGSVQLGFDEARSANRPSQGHLAPSGKLFRTLREFRVGDTSGIEVGQEIDVTQFEPGDRIDATGWSKGRGFAGGVKRYNFRGGPKTHGQSDRHRAPGSIGAGTTPGRVLKGKKMAGHMGDRRVTVRNLEVVRIEPERNLLFVRGAVPGAHNGLLIIKKSRFQKG
jgi:large subunit ribosomal protein L3